MHAMHSMQVALAICLPHAADPPLGTSVQHFSLPMPAAGSPAHRHALPPATLRAPCLQVGKKNKSVGATLMNKDSSRSHSIFTITIETIEAGAGGVGCHLMGRWLHLGASGVSRCSLQMPTLVYLSKAHHIQEAQGSFSPRLRP